MSTAILVEGKNKLVQNLFIRMDFIGEDRFHLHLWKRMPKTGGNVGTAFNHPQGLRQYALGLLEMCDRFEEQARPEFVGRGGSWLSPEESAKMVVLEGESK